MATSSSITISKDPVTADKFSRTRAGLKLIAIVSVVVMIIVGVLAYLLVSSPDSYTSASPTRTEGTVVGGPSSYMEGKVSYTVLPVELSDGYVVNISTSKDDNLTRGSSVTLWTAEVPKSMTWIPAVFPDDEMRVDFDEASGLSISRSEFLIVDAVKYDDWHVAVICLVISALATFAMMALIRFSAKGDPSRSVEKADADDDRDVLTLIGIYALCTFIIMMIIHASEVRNVTSEGFLWSFWALAIIVGAGWSVAPVIMALTCSPKAVKELARNEEARRAR